MYRDNNSNLAAITSLAPAVRTADADGAGVDLQGADSATVIVNVGAITGSVNGTSAVVLEESDDDAAYTDVAAADILGSEPVEYAAATAYQFGYIGTKRYIRATHVKGGETNAATSAVVVKGHLHTAPSEQSNAAPTYTGT